MDFIVSYIGESSGPGAFRDIDWLSFDGGKTKLRWWEDIIRVWCPDAEERGEVVILEDGDTVYFETTDGDEWEIDVDVDDDELVFHIQERIYPT